MKKQSRSFLFVTIFVPVAAFIIAFFMLTFYVIYASHEYRESFEQTGLSSLELYMDQLSDTMRAAEETAVRLYKYEESGEILQSSSNETLKTVASYDIINHASDNLSWNRNLRGYAVFYNDLRSRRFCFRSNLSVKFREAVITEMRHTLQSETKPSGWYPYTWGDQCYLYYTYRERDVVLCSLILLPSNLPEAEGGMAVACRSGEQWLSKEPEGFRIRDLVPGETVFLDNDQWMILDQKIPDVEGVHAVAYFPVVGSFRSSSSRLIIYVGAFLLMSVLIIGGLAGRHYLVRPLYRMLDTIKKIGNGRFDSRMEISGSDVREYQMIEGAFNEMLDEIQNLKIEQYEQQLAGQAIQLQYLKLQLEPHFMLNCLTSLYALTKEKKLEKLENRILTLSDYFRYELSDDFDLRPLKDELEFTRNAVLIRRDTLEHGVELEEEIDRKQLDTPVPPMIIETFVENAIKYACAEEKLLIRVSVTTETMEEEDGLRIRIRDNGKGFSERWLAVINQGVSDDEGRHIGLLNLKKRLGIMYRGKAKFVIYNEYGAVTDIWIPIREVQS